MSCCCNNSYSGLPCCCPANYSVTTTTTCPFGICCDLSCENGEICEEVYSSDCAIYSGQAIVSDCFVIEPGMDLTEVLEIVMTYICSTTTTTTAEPTTTTSTTTSTTSTTTTATPDPLCVENQGWSLFNLDVTTYANGDPIPEVQDQTTWNSLTTGAWCSYNNNPANDVIYGKLYNWYAVNDPRGLAPTGYHIPSAAEWSTLITCLGGDSIAGGKMKEVGTTNWLAPNTGATNSSGFTALPGGVRFPNFLAFQGIGDYAEWWSSLSLDPTQALYFSAASSNTVLGQGPSDKATGRSIRIIPD